METVVAAVAGGEDAQLELFPERVPFPRHLLVERQPVSRPAHEQDARLHAAASASARSMRPKTESRSFARTEEAAAARSADCRLSSAK